MNFNNLDFKKQANQQSNAVLQELHCFGDKNQELWVYFFRQLRSYYTKYITRKKAYSQGTMRASTKVDSLLIFWSCLRKMIIADSTCIETKLKFKCPHLIIISSCQGLLKNCFKFDVIFRIFSQNQIYICAKFLFIRGHL